MDRCWLHGGVQRLINGYLGLWLSRAGNGMPVRNAAPAK